MNIKLEHGKDRYGAVWSFERCKAPHCKGRRNIIGFHVPDEIWNAVVPKGINIVCLACFDEMAQAKGIKYQSVLKVFPPVTWEDVY